MASLAAEEEAAQRAATEEAISQLGEVLEMAKEHGPKQPQLREMASEFFLGLTDTEQGRRALHTQGATKVLLSWCGDSVDAVAASSYEALVNLSSDVLEARLEFMLGLKAVDRVFETLKDNAVSARLTNAALMFLSNLTTAKDACMDALQSSLGDPLLIGVRMRRLVEKFLDPALQPKAEGELDAWEHVASVLCNVSQLQDGRDLLRRRSTNVLPRLILELESPSAVRRRGTAAALRNCCYETLDHDWLLHEVGLLGRLLLSLAGPEPMTAGETNGMEELVLTKLEAQGANKQREPDFETRKAILNALHLLCSTKVCKPNGLPLNWFQRTKRTTSHSNRLLCIHRRLRGSTCGGNEPTLSSAMPIWQKKKGQNSRKCSTGKKTVTFLKPSAY
jgi:hypothetical protein